MMRRSAVLTAFAVGNARATSGSRTTTLLPAANRPAYLPRTPPEKSYSVGMGRSRTARALPAAPRFAEDLPGLFAVFFILSPLVRGGASGADDAYHRCRALDMNDNEEAIQFRSAEEEKAIFVLRMIGVRDSERKGAFALTPLSMRRGSGHLRRR